MNDLFGQPANRDDRDGNPYRSPDCQEPVASTADRPTMLWFRVAAVFQCLTIICGVVAAFMDIESILVSGVVVSVTGLAGLVAAVKGGHGAGAVFSGSGPAMAVFCFRLIFLQEWSPSEAQEPVSALIAIYGVAFVPFGAFVIFRGPADATQDSASVYAFSAVRDSP